MEQALEDLINYLANQANRYEKKNEERSYGRWEAYADAHKQAKMFLEEARRGSGKPT